MVEFHLVVPSSNERGRTGRKAGVAALVCGLVLAVAIVSMSSKGPRSTGLAMMGDIATINDIHSAYIHGSVPTAIGESNDIMNLNFPDERFGSDSKEHGPAHVRRGHVITFPEEAGDIVARGENHGVAAHKDVKTAEALKDKSRRTQLAMMGDIATINDIHSAYIHGSVPTAIGESNDIMNLNFPDERFGSDSKEHMPSAYVRGTVITFPEEAGDIVARGEKHGVAAHKDVKASEALRTQTKQKLLQLHAFNQAHKALPTSMLGMTGDISTMGDIHAAYIHGSVPTSVGESDDIMNLNFPDERNGADSKEFMPSAYVRGSVNTAADEAGDITAKSSSATGMKKGPVTSLAGLLKEEQALTKQEGEEEKKNDSNMLKIDDKEEAKAIKAETAVTHELAV